MAVMRLEGLLCVIAFRHSGAAPLLWRLDLAEALIIYSFKKIQELMGAKCAHFLFDSFLGLSLKVVFSLFFDYLRA